jgi:MtN3 and saliva related transmembrane protein
MGYGCYETEGAAMNLLQLGLLAGALTSCAVLPQIFRAFRTRQVRDISVWQPVLLVAGMGLWLLYGILIGDLPLIAANIFSISCNLLLITLKYLYSENRVFSKALTFNRTFPTIQIHVDSLGSVRQPCKDFCPIVIKSTEEL